MDERYYNLTAHELVKKFPTVDEKQSFIISSSSIRPLGRFVRNQSHVRRPVWLWYAAY
jgi:hypothetical protein